MYIGYYKSPEIFDNYYIVYYKFYPYILIDGSI